MDFVLIKNFQEPIELSDAHPFDQIDMLRENGIGLATKCSRYDFFYTSFSRRLSKQPRIRTVSGDNSENLRWPHWSFVTEKCSIARTQSSARRRARAPQTLPVVAAAFDVQLGERFLQRRLNGRHFFGGMVFLHCRLCALDCGLGRSNVDLFGFKGHVS